MTNQPGDRTEPAEARLFWNGRSQAVRLPKQFRFSGDRVRVSRAGSGVLLEPVPARTRECVEEWFARIDALRGDPIFPAGRRQNPAPVRDFFE
jgi:antitoxin VapB